jgi:hypothetical protein
VGVISCYLVQRVVHGQQRHQAASVGEAAPPRGRASGGHGQLAPQRRRRRRHPPAHRLRVHSCDQRLSTLEGENLGLPSQVHKHLMRIGWTLDHPCTLSRVLTLTCVV